MGESSIGRYLKDEGMRIAAENRSRLLVEAQAVARKLGKDAIIDIDTVRDYYFEKELPWELGNAAGSVFKGEEWEFVGYTTSRHQEGHARIIRRWKLKPTLF